MKINKILRTVADTKKSSFLSHIINTSSNSLVSLLLTSSHKMQRDRKAGSEGIPNNGAPGEKFHLNISLNGAGGLHSSLRVILGPGNVSVGRVLICPWVQCSAPHKWCLPSPGFSPQHHRNQMQWHTSAVPALRR